MATYIVAYDLNKKGKNYDGLIDAIKKISGAWCHALESTWFVTSNLTAMQILEKLRSQIDSDDELFVMLASNRAAWIGLDPRASDWLKKNL